MRYGLAKKPICLDRTQKSRNRCLFVFICLTSDGQGNYDWKSTSITLYTKTEDKS